MDLGIAGRTAIVCASSRGLGRACAVELARAGCRLVINGRDPERESRNVVGNLNEREAAWLAREIRADLLVPMHYDLFPGNRGYPSLLLHSIERDHPGVAVHVPARNRAFVYTAPGSR